MRLFLPALCLFVIIFKCHSNNRLRKCCPPSFSVDGSDPTFPMCRKGTGPDLSMNQSRPLPPHFPNCKKDFEIHKSNSSLSYDGRGYLITSKYGRGSPIKDFCVDYLVNTTDLVAVTCDLCKAKKVLCINICCPHGSAFKFNTTLGDYSCDRDAGSNVYDPRFFNRYEQEVELKLNSDYYLTAPSPHLTLPLTQCPQHNHHYIGITFAPEDLGEFKLKTSGNLDGEKVVRPEDGGRVRGRSSVREERRFKREVEREGESQPLLQRVSYKTDEYCMIYGDPPHTAQETIVQTYMTCTEGTENWGEQLNSYFSPITKSIALFFFIFTVTIQLVVPDRLRSNYGKISTVIVVFNILIILNSLIGSTLEAESPGCIMSGYTGQFTSLAFFCLMFCLALDIFLKFRAMEPHTDPSLERKKCARYLAISLLAPFIICSITAVVDHLTVGWNYRDKLSCPEMGVYDCFLGSARTNGNILFLQKPEFIYFGFWIILIMFGSGFLMVWTSQKFCSHGLEHGSCNDDGDGIIQKLSKQFLIVIKLQGIFIILSFPWIFDIVCFSYINDGTEMSGIWRVVGDTWTLISSIALFFLVFSSKTRTKFRQRISLLTGSSWLSASD